MPKDTLTGRDNAGRFLPGQSGNPAGRPQGSANKALQQLREWTLEKGLPMLIEQAEAGDTDALRLLVSLGLPKQKSVAQPLDCLQDVPDPTSAESLKDTAQALFSLVKQGQLAREDAAELLKLAETVKTLTLRGTSFSLR